MILVEHRSAGRMNAGIARTLLSAAFAAYLAAPQIAAAAPVESGKGADIAVAAFKDVCLRSAPSFATASAKAKRYGIKELLSFGNSAMGMTDDHSLSVEIKPNRECSVTSPNRSNPALHAQFLRAVGEFADTPQANTAGTPFQGVVKGYRFAFLHDRKGGEAYVMLSLEK